MVVVTTGLSYGRQTTEGDTDIMLPLGHAQVTEVLMGRQLSQLSTGRVQGCTPLTGGVTPLGIRVDR